MVSRRKRAANRRNARKSTGPKTERGKRIVSGNALVHGLRSQRWPVLPFEDEGEYREFARAVERDYAPVGIVQRELVSHITQLLWKLRRIPAIEQALLESQRMQLDEALEEAKCRRRIDMDATPEKTTTAKLLAVEFATENGFGYERLEIHRGRLERGLHAAMRQLKKAREETCGEELSKPQQAAYAIEEFGRVVDQAREIREAKEAVKSETTDPKAAPQSSPTVIPGGREVLRGMGVSPVYPRLKPQTRGRGAHATTDSSQVPSELREPENRSSPSKATEGETVDKARLACEMRPEQATLVREGLSAEGNPDEVGFS